MKDKLISASILSADFGHLAQEVNDVMEAGADYIHFDVMDHHFVPNLSFGSVVCSALRKAKIKAPIDVHLMVENPEQYIKPFAKAGADLITFHPETVSDVEAVVDAIHAAGMQAGLVFNPDKPVNISIDLARKLQMILLMSVFPGFGGQCFIEETFDKIQETREWLDKNNINAILAVDGGIKVENIKEISKAGADYFVIGSGLFSANDYAERVRELRAEIK